MTALSDLVEARVNELGLTSRAVAERSAKVPDGPISAAVVAKYRTSKHPMIPDARVMKVLAKTLGIRLDAMERAARVPESQTEWVPPPEVRWLPRSDLDLLDTFVRRLAADYLTRAQTAGEGDMTVTVVDFSETDNPAAPGPDDDLSTRQSEQPNGSEST